MTEQPHALVEKTDHTLVVTMNRPEKRNALSGDMLAIMSDAWDQVNDDPDIRVAILTGAGGAFGGMSSSFRRLQTGFVRSYALSVLAGAVLVVVALLAVNLA